MEKFKDNIENTFSSSDNLYIEPESKPEPEISQIKDNGVTRFYSEAKYGLIYKKLTYVQIFIMHIY